MDRDVVAVAILVRFVPSVNESGEKKMIFKIRLWFKIDKGSSSPRKT